MNDPRYDIPRVQRQWELSQALIELRSYEWRHIDAVAAGLSDADTATVLRVVRALNKKDETAAA